MAGTIDGPEGEPIGVACAHQSDPPEAAFVGALVPGSREAAITVSLVAWLLQRCGRLEVEADDGEGAHATLVSVLRTIPNARWPEPLQFVELNDTQVR